MPNHARTTHATTQTFGLTLVAASFVSVLVLSLLFLGSDELAPFIVLAVILGSAALLTWRVDTTWSKAIGLVASTLALGGFFLGFGLFQIFSPFEFVVAIAYVGGWVLSLVGGIRAIVSRRKGRLGRTAGEARLPSIALGVIVVAAAVSIAGFYATRQTVSEADTAGATTIEMVNFEFDPGTVSMRLPGTAVVHNSDPFVHDIVIDELGISETVGPGGTILVDFSGATPGTYEFVCTLHSSGGEGMTGVLEIGG